jgi:hypothetical protein
VAAVQRHYVDTIIVDLLTSLFLIIIMLSALFALHLMETFSGECSSLHIRQRRECVDPIQRVFVYSDISYMCNILAR